MGSLPTALQLYSVRDHMETDVAGTLKRVKDIGYDAVEVAGLCGLDATEYKRLCDDARLRPVSMHVMIEEVTGNPNGAISAAKTLGVDYVVVPCMSGDWVENAQALDTAGARMRAAGLTLCYHNHDMEMAELDGKRVFDIVFEQARPENLATQIDTAWVQIGGADPVALLGQYAGRCPTVHVKDYVEIPDGHEFVPVGEGCMDWPAVLEAAEAAGARWFIVEQDTWGDADSIECARTSAAFLARC
ncbi:MAG TPA: sugar phosphate isomerase/epimerase [Candidatus Hydrogenedentes bacterium]|nr:sugar phosphate isomerase/epimerase [Candidatus Hydrogenedentota bacterium]